MATKTAWVGRCLVHTQPIADEPHEHPWNAECYAAVWTDSKPNFEQRLHDHFQAQGQYLVWAEEVFSVLHWLNRHGHHRTIVNLAKTVDGNHDMALSPLVPRGKEGKPPPPPTYLTITEHDIPALPDQERVPRWEQEWIVPELKDLLFGQPDAGDSKPLRTYLIVDAWLRTKITVIYDLDQLDVPVRCLVRPDKAEELRDVAPYLIDMTLPKEAWDDRTQVPEFHIDFIANHWVKGTGIIVRTSANMDAVWTHFHQFVRVQVEDTQEWLFFRYWDPRTAPTYFDSIKDIPEKVVHWMDMPDNQRIECIISHQAAHALAITPDWGKLKDFASIGPFILSVKEMKAFENYYENKIIIKIAKSIHTVAPTIAQELGMEDLLKTVKNSIIQAKEYSITLDTDLAYFSYISYIHTFIWQNHPFYAEINDTLHDKNVAPYLKIDLIKYRYKKKFSSIKTTKQYQNIFSKHPRLNNTLYFNDFIKSLDINYFSLR